MSISASAYEILNDAERSLARDQWFAILQDLFDGRNNPYLDKRVMTIAGTVISRPQDPQLAYSNPERWVAECLELLAEAVQKTDDTVRFIPACVEYPIYGVHFIDRIFGAEVFFKNGQWYNNVLTSSIGTLQIPDLFRNETWNLAKRAALAFLEQGVSLPLFSMPTLSSALNIVVNLYGEDALMMMVEEPDAIRHDLEVINDVLLSLHTWYRKTVPAVQLQPVISWSRTQPPGCGQLCGCTTQLVSGAMYRDMFAPLDDALLGLYPGGGMIHLCGSHTQHIETMRDMKYLKALQLNDAAALDLNAYFKGLREDQIFYINPSVEMTVEKAIECTGGRRLVICDAIEAPVR